MDFTLLFSKVVGPVLLIRAVSILLDRRHFVQMLEGVERETGTVAFSFFPIALFMAGAAIAVTQWDVSSPAGILIQVIAWGGMIKATALMLFPRGVAAKARLLGQAGFLYVVTFVCIATIVGPVRWPTTLGLASTLCRPRPPTVRNPQQTSYLNIRPVDLSVLFASLGGRRLSVRRLYLLGLIMISPGIQISSSCLLPAG